MLLVIDLNGYTLSFPDGGFIDVQSWGYLKIIDSTGGGKVTSANRFAVWVNYGGYMIVEGGCLETTNTTGDPREKSAVYNQGVIFTNADINHDGYITQDDIDAVVKLIMETMNNKENE